MKTIDNITVIGKAIELEKNSFRITYNWGDTKAIIDLRLDYKDLLATFVLKLEYWFTEYEYATNLLEGLPVNQYSIDMIVKAFRDDMIDHNDRVINKWQESVN